MSAEMIIAAFIVCIATMPIIIIGIVQYKKKENPVGFWSGKKAPEKEQITDVTAYNRKHGLMWILYGAGFIACFLCGFLFGGEIGGILSTMECVGGLFVMVAYHNKLNDMYSKKESDE